MKTNNLILLLFGILFLLFGFVFWWFKFRSSKYVSGVVGDTIEENKSRFTAKDVIKSGGAVLLDVLHGKAQSYLDNKTNRVK